MNSIIDVSLAHTQSGCICVKARYQWEYGISLAVTTGKVNGAVSFQCANEH